MDIPGPSQMMHTYGCPGGRNVIHLVSTYCIMLFFNNGSINSFLVLRIWILDIRDWSLITGRGGATKREGGGAPEVLPLRKGGAEKVLAMLKGGHTKFRASFYVVA